MKGLLSLLGAPGRALSNIAVNRRPALPAARKVALLVLANLLVLWAIWLLWAIGKIQA